MSFYCGNDEIIFNEPALVIRKFVFLSFIYTASLPGKINLFKILYRSMNKLKYCFVNDCYKLKSGGMLRSGT